MDGSAQGLDLGGRWWIVVQIELGQPNAADVEADSGARRVLAHGADHQLRRATPDIDHQNGRAEQLCPGYGQGAAQRERCLLRPADDLGHDAQPTPHDVDQPLTVGRVPGGGCGHEPHSFSTEAADGVGVIGQRRVGALERGLAEPPRLGHRLTEPDDAQFAMQLGELAAPELSDEQPQRVGTAVDACDDHWPSGAGHSDGTQGPPAHQACRRSSTSSPTGLTPGPAASACASKACRHLTRVGMPPALTPSISGTSPSLAPAGGARGLGGGTRRSRIELSRSACA